MTPEQIAIFNKQTAKPVDEAKTSAHLRSALEHLDLHELSSGVIVENPDSFKYLDQFISVDPEVEAMKEIVRNLAFEEHDPVLIHGDTGTGKELIARALHGNRKGKFIAVNTTSMPDTLVESELFGHVAGAFTDAKTSRIGKFEAAKGGTIFLDEIGDMPMNLQAKLLRVLQQRVITPVGSNEEREISCRVIAATHKEIRKETESSVIWLPSFREDLYWRIAVHTVTIPPLSARRDDIREILDAVLDPHHSLTELQRDSFDTMPLTGNFRELSALVKRMQLYNKIASRNKVVAPTTGTELAR